MNKRNWLIICALMMSAVLAGCNVPASGPDPYSAVVITKFGPTEVHAGVPFNKQPDGNSAVWMDANRSLAGNHVAIYFDGTPLQTVIKGSEITALVPPRLYARTGTHMLWVAGKGMDGNKIKSNKVRMVVK